MSISNDGSLQPRIIKYDSNLEDLDTVEYELLNCYRNLGEIRKDWAPYEYGTKLQQIASQSMEHHNSMVFALLYEIIAEQQVDLDEVFH